MDDAMPSTSQRTVQRQLDQLNLILWAAWDPIGLGVPTDEYASYAPRVLALLQAGSREGVVAEELSRIRSEQMGVPGCPDADSRAADKLCEWYEEVTGQRDMR